MVVCKLYFLFQYDVSGYVVIEEGTEEELTEAEAVEEDGSIEEEASGDESNDEEVMNEVAEDEAAVFVYDDNYGINSMEEIGLI